MNLFEILTWEEKRVFLQFLKEVSMSEFAIINGCTREEVDEHRQSIIAKLEKNLAEKTPETYMPQISCR